MAIPESGEGVVLHAAVRLRTVREQKKISGILLRTFPFPQSGVARNRSHAGIVCCCFVFCFVYFREADGKGCRVRGAMTTILESSFFLARLVYDYSYSSR